MEIPIWGLAFGTSLLYLCVAGAGGVGKVPKMESPLAGQYSGASGSAFLAQRPSVLNTGGWAALSRWVSGILFWIRPLRRSLAMALVPFRPSADRCRPSDARENEERRPQGAPCLLPVPHTALPVGQLTCSNQSGPHIRPGGSGSPDSRHASQCPDKSTGHVLGQGHVPGWAAS